MTDKFGSNAVFVSETEFGRLAWAMNATVNIIMPLEECIGLKRMLKRVSNLLALNNSDKLQQKRLAHYMSYISLHLNVKRDRYSKSLIYLLDETK